MSGPTLEQRRARHAWEAVARLKNAKPEDAKDCKGEAKKLPVRIMTSGLGQALAFLKAKSGGKKTGLDTLLDRLSDWVVRGRRLPGVQGSDQDLMKNIISGDAVFLRRATDETLAYLQWFNRFAEAELPKEGPPTDKDR
jgi:CRISPR-associated protein Cmr5